MIYKGLDDEEASFLTFIAQRQADQETEVIKREIEEVHLFRVSPIIFCFVCPLLFLVLDMC